MPDDLENNLAKTHVDRCHGCAEMNPPPYQETMENVQGRPTATCGYITYSIHREVRNAVPFQNACEYQGEWVKQFYRLRLRDRVARLFQKKVLRQTPEYLPRYECKKTMRLVE